LKKKKPFKINSDEILDNAPETDPAEAAAMAAAEVADELEDAKDAGNAKAEGDGAVEAKDDKAEDGDAAEEAKAEDPEKKENEWKEKYTRQLAEFDNFRKRTEKEKSQMYDYGAKNIAEKILPTIDNFERGLKGAPEGAFAEGMEMVYKQLLKNLEEAGVKAIDCVGKEFDPNIHNAVMHEEDDSGEENIVTEELQKGYMYKDTLLRASMVKVKN